MNESDLPISLLTNGATQRATRPSSESSANRRRLPATIDLPPSLFRVLMGLATLFLSRSNRRATKALPIFLNYLASNQVFANERTQQLISSSEIRLPPPDAYLINVIDYYLMYPSGR